MDVVRKYAGLEDSLTDETLAPLRTYKYSSVDKSYISRYILKHYVLSLSALFNAFLFTSKGDGWMDHLPWNAFVELLPLWIAPNMVTLLGFGFIVGNVVLLEIYMPNLVGPAPSWVYYSFAIGIWMYSTMDNVDGKQARRTGTSSPLGELFDHGIDSLNCTLASLLEVAAMGQGSTKIGAFTMLIPCLPMFFSTWETYHTHTLYLGYFNGPTEGLIIATSIIIAAGYYGPEIYSRPLADGIGYKDLLGNITFLDIWVFVLLTSFFTAHLPECVYNVVQARRRSGLPVLPIFLEWTSIIVSSISAISWVYSPYSFILKDNHLVLFAVTLCFVFGRMTTKIILAHLTRQPFPYWTVLITPLIGGAVLVNLPAIGLPSVGATVELWYLWGYLAFAFAAYMHWALYVIGRITTFLDINCLTIKKRHSSSNGPVLGVITNSKMQAGFNKPVKLN
ncbi:cholinephosphotransferase 1 [Nannizzia gypsea CBS 118893]|uniref:Cholinephosphotransferase 1 n=1 Tax=Arthroderma gypseum (strain ATCC MYA-4604 / CBS 118893) TaxID=535722 RepID=E4UY76_ARTGP|nr:cholinephosphotransferase 1 [Nannizzia gypsea CBS 118893]EFR02039.1 cholinephosphotransferase 1 [Nannizzia gypsea CBS 118893]